MCHIKFETLSSLSQEKEKMKEKEEEKSPTVGVVRGQAKAFIA